MADQLQDRDALRLDIPTEYAGLVQDAASVEEETVFDTLYHEENMDSDQERSLAARLLAAHTVRQRLGGLRESGGIQIDADAGLIVRIADEVLVRLARDLQDAVEEPGHDPGECRRVADAVEWFVSLRERADAALTESVLGAGA